MNLHRLMIIHFILSCPNVLTCDNRYFKICPQNGSASLGSSFIFNCVTIMKIKKCVWIKPNSLNVYPTSGVKKYSILSNQSCSMTISKIEKEDYGWWTCNPELLKDGSAVAGAILLQKKDRKVNIDKFYFIILFTSVLLSIITGLMIISYIIYKKNRTT